MLGSGAVFRNDVEAFSESNFVCWPELDRLWLDESVVVDVKAYLAREAYERELHLAGEIWVGCLSTLSLMTIRNFDKTPINVMMYSDAAASGVTG